MAPSVVGSDQAGARGAQCRQNPQIVPICIIRAIDRRGHRGRADRSICAGPASRSWRRPGVQIDGDARRLGRARPFHHRRIAHTRIRRSRLAVTRSMRSALQTTRRRLLRNTFVTGTHSVRGMSARSVGTAIRRCRRIAWTVSVRVANEFRGCPGAAIRASGTQNRGVARSGWDPGRPGRRCPRRSSRRWG